MTRKGKVSGRRRKKAAAAVPAAAAAPPVVRRDRNKGVEMLDQFGRMKPIMYKAHRKSTPGLQNSLTTIWNSQMLSKVYAGAQPFDLSRKVFKERAAASVFRSPTPLPWKNSGQITLRQWIPPKT
jgi:hypothetical protein